MRMWRRISNLAAAAALLAMVCVCTMLPLAAATIHHEGGGAPSQGRGGGGGGNPANDLVAQVNADRAAAKLPALRGTKGLGCMALQCIARCLTLSPTTACAPNGTLSPRCHPPETDITEVYAANCGVELPTVDVISGRILGCSQSFEGVALHTANETVVRGREHAQVGAGVVKGFWCLLLSSGSPNSTFLLENAGRGIAQTHGCFSDPDILSCTVSAWGKHQTRRLTTVAMALLLLLLFLL